MTVVTRFAPSPTGFLHIGGARTALFNWLFARSMGGKFLLRIEDTDRARSTHEAVEAILNGLHWLELEWDGDHVSQYALRDRHAEVAKKLVDEGKAYYCYCTKEELEEMREQARKEGRRAGYDGRWRDRAPSEAPEGVEPTVRLKTPQEGETIIKDLVQGEVRVENKQLDDMILLRADGSPTYMLSVVVDDHDMGITHVIRGDDHLTNMFRQAQIYDAMGWDRPEFAHIPLIHGPDGKKLSKRHGALSVEAYREMGYLPVSMRNYLMRLGWSHGDDEIISMQQALEWFTLEGINKAASNFDFQKLDHMNAHYIRNVLDFDELVDHIAPHIETALNRGVDDADRALLEKAMPDLTPRAKNINDLAESTLFYLRERPLELNDKASKILDDDGLAALAKFSAALADLDDFTAEPMEQLARDFAEENDLKLGKVAQPFRAALTGSNVSPPIFKAAELLGREETLARIDDVLPATLKAAAG